MALYAIQVVGETPRKGVLVLPTFIKNEAIQWKEYGDSCSCLFKKSRCIFAARSGCQGLCKTKSAFWTAVAAEWLDDLTTKLRTASGIHFNRAQVATFRDGNGNWVEKWDNDQKIKKAYRFEGFGPDGDIKNLPIADEGTTQKPLLQPGGESPYADEITYLSYPVGGDNTTLHPDLPPPYSEGQANLEQPIEESNLTTAPDPTMADLDTQLMDLNLPYAELGLWEDILKQAHEWQFKLLSQLMDLNLPYAKLGLWKDILKQARERQFKLLSQLMALNPSYAELGLRKDILKRAA